MRLPEQRLWDRWKRNAKKYVSEREIRFDRIENGVGEGFPDVLSLYRGGIVRPVELKQRNEPPTKRTTPLLGDKYGLRPDQRSFHANWNALGGVSYVLVGIGEGHDHRIFCVEGTHARSINLFTLDDFECASSARSWAEFFALLMGNVP